MNKVRSKSISRTLRDAANAFFKSKYCNDLTSRAYVHSYRKYIDFCRNRFNCKTVDDCSIHIQEYADYLITYGYSASTVHSYLAAVCIYHNVNMKEISKPKRCTSEYTKNRKHNGRTARKDNDADLPEHSGTVEFARRVGIRRSELYRLKGGDFVIDESGNACVRVKRGKGGKMQLQRIMPDDIDFVAAYFANVGADDYVFTRDDLKNKIAYHYIRAKHAQNFYKYICDKLEADPLYRDVLLREIRARWNIYNINTRTGKPKRLPASLYSGDYILRGKNKAHALRNHLPIVYSRLALLATSIFCLSHWRLDVTVCSYLLVV